MKNEIKNQALSVIEAITSGDCKGLSEKQKDAIYRFAHCVLFRCKNPHHDWVMELKQTYENYKKAKII